MTMTKGNSMVVPLDIVRLLLAIKKTRTAMNSHIKSGQLPLHEHPTHMHNFALSLPLSRLAMNV